MVEWMDRWTNILMNGWMVSLNEYLMDGRKDVKMDGWLNGNMNG
jgi:hypothetical protein